MTDQWVPKSFIGDIVSVEYEEKPSLIKKPHAPDAFTWGGETYCVATLISAWVDYTRRGRMARNMRPEHLTSAARRGSWGVGRFYFRVLTARGRCFDLYYDRAPEEAGDRGGHWYLYRELERVTDES